MKLCKLISAGVATIAISAVMCISAYAATEFKTGTPKYDEEEDEYSVVVQVKSNDYEKLATAKFSVGYDTSKYTFSTISSKTGTCVGNEGADGISGTLISYASPYGMDLSPTAYKTIATLYFSKGPGEDNMSADDFKILNIDNLSYMEGVKAIDISAEELGTYVLYRFPKEVDDSWTDGYIQKLQAVVKAGGTTKATVDISNYYEDGSDYVFVLKLVPSEKTKVDIDILASLSPKKDTPSSEWTTKVINTISNVTAEKLQ